MHVYFPLLPFPTLARVGGENGLFYRFRPKNTQIVVFQIRRQKPAKAQVYCAFAGPFPL